VTNDKIRALAKDLDDYMRARAVAEGVAYKLNAAFYINPLEFGVDTYFGVVVDLEEGVLKFDDQEPGAGFLESWLQARPARPAEPEMTA
jgi:hypothetical protein